MQKKISFIGFLFFSFSLIAAQAQPFATQTICFLTDDSDPSSGDLGKQEIALMARTLFLHLLEKETALIVTSSVFHALMEFLKINNNPMLLIPTPRINPADFITQKINDYIFIVIPKSYITSRSNYTELKKRLSKENKTGYTIEELTIGMKLNRPEIPAKEFFNPKYYIKTENFPKRTIPKSPIIWSEIKNGKKVNHTIERTRPASWISKKVVDTLPDIFIPQDVYTKLKLLECAPISVIIAAGHGTQYVPIHKEIKALQKEFGTKAADEIEKLKALQKQGYVALLGGEIAGFDSKDFAEFLAYINKNIHPPLIFFNTCFGSGVNVEAALRALEKKELGNTTIIISGAISNAPVYETTTIDDIRPGNDPNMPVEKTIIRRPLYKKFLKQLNNKKPISDDFFIDAIDTIYTLYGEASGYNNIPIIKYPNQPWRPLNMPDKLIIIDQLFVAAYQNQKSVSLSSLFSLQKKPHPRVVLLAVPEIPFELTIEGKDLTKLPIFISYEPPGNAIHHIKGISAPQYSISDVVHNFFTIEDLYDNTLILVDRLTAQNDTSLLNKRLKQPSNLDNVMFIHRPQLSSQTPPLFLLKFHYGNQDWKANITKIPFKSAVEKDHSGLLSVEWQEAMKLVT